MGAPVLNMNHPPEPARDPGTQPSDGELLERARSGDSRAFQRLVERYEHRVASTVIGMLGAGDEADDVGQEVFVRFFRAMNSYRGEASLATYLTRIAINLSLTALKRRKRMASRFLRRSERESAATEPAWDPENSLEREARIAAVRLAIGKLKPDHRAVIVLRMIDGYSTKEAAALLGVPPGTVMSRLARAMKSLQVELEEVPL